MTPNPDVLCNREIKFAHFLRFAHERLAAPLVATGHYARLAHGGEAYAHREWEDDKAEDEEPPPRLLAGVDEGKDQSYFLSHVPATAFRRVLFPLGRLRKAEVGAWVSGWRCLLMYICMDHGSMDRLPRHRMWLAVRACIATGAGAGARGGPVHGAEAGEHGHLLRREAPVSAYL